MALFKTFSFQLIHTVLYMHSVQVRLAFHCRVQVLYSHVRCCLLKIPIIIDPMTVHPGLRLKVVVVLGSLTNQLSVAGQMKNEWA